tara:strand:+ start:612 stop:716 length:105 start_codon:yes stop_codon:yes gene_type:complete
MFISPIVSPWMKKSGEGLIGVRKLSGGMGLLKLS